LLLILNIMILTPRLIPLTLAALCGPLWACGDDPPRQRGLPARPDGGRRIIVNKGKATLDGGVGPQIDPDSGQPFFPPPAAPDTRAPPPPPPHPPDNGIPKHPGCGHNTMEQQVFVLLNQERTSRGLAPLACDPAAVKAARDFSQRMCDQGFFSHYGPGGSTVSSRLKAAGAKFYAAGENIAKGYKTPQSVNSGWMNSSGHRKNMLSSYWDRVGIGYVLCKGYKAYWTEDFLK